MKNYKVIICVSDIHAPYSAPYLVPFLKAIKEKYTAGLKPSEWRCVLLGDELDYHASSYHESSTELPSAKAELNAAIKKMKPIYDLFPVADVLESNHGSLAYRKANTAGLAAQVIKPYREVINAPKGWVWHPELVLKSGDNTIYFTHGKTGQPGRLGASENCCAVQGHFHEKFQVTYWRNSRGQTLWDAHLGCLIDAESLAFAYNKTNLKRPVIGTGVIVNGHMQLIPMDLKNRRWTGLL